MSKVPQAIKTKLAELATFPEKYSLYELSDKLMELSLEILMAANQESELTQNAIKIE